MRLAGTPSLTAPALLRTVEAMRFDSIAVVEAAYRVGASERDWLERVSEAAAPGIEQGLGVGWVYWQLSDLGVQVAAAGGDLDDGLRTLIPRTYEGFSPEFMRRAFSGPPWVDRISDIPEVHTLLRHHVDRNAEELGLSIAASNRPADVVAMQVGDGARHGITIGAFSLNRGQLDLARRRVLTRVMSHVGAALRLRDKLEASAPLVPDAVLEPGGKVQHASALAQGAAARRALVEAVRAIERARGPQRRHDPEQALSAWRALVDGTWSVVDWVDTDGRRYLVAHENRLPTRDPRSLAPREREVAEYLIHGRSNGEIAYALGLAEGTVNRIARTVLRKLGGARRADLPMLFEPQAQLATHNERDTGLVSLRAEPRERATWERLPRALREVAELAVSGASNDEIASARGRSARTVANQLARCYELLGVRGRTELVAVLGPPLRD
jgi:DNA-binding NarL/FixJ family response regulator